MGMNESVPKPSASEAGAQGAAGESDWAGCEPGVAPGKEGLADAVVEMLHTCFDPEIPVDIYELGLIYKIGVDGDSRVLIEMTLTSPACPVAGSLPGEVEEKLRMIPDVKDVKVRLVWEPPWSQAKMSEAARLELGFY